MIGQDELLEVLAHLDLNDLCQMRYVSKQFVLNELLYFKYKKFEKLASDMDHLLKGYQRFMETMIRLYEFFDLKNPITNERYYIHDYILHCTNGFMFLDGCRQNRNHKQLDFCIKFPNEKVYMLAFDHDHGAEKMKFIKIEYKKFWIDIFMKLPDFEECQFLGKDVKLLFE